MLFNSVDFAVFLPVVFLAHWFLARQNRKAQNILLLVASYVFYGWWDWRFLTLIALSSVIDYAVGLGLAKSTHRPARLRLLLLSLAVNLGSLGFFKYFGFFAQNFASAFTLLGYPIDQQGLDIVLPVGISFYTFQTLSYTIDVFRGKLEPTTDVVSFLAFVSFFPQLVAGPIERATKLMPQFFKARVFRCDYAVDGLRQLLWGLFKKVVVADNCAAYANDIFVNHADYSGSTLALGAVFFAFQIYGDFSGYSDIAIGTARLFGIGLSRNFAYPYFSRDIAEFWRRWHISLSTWFRDYLYIPLGGSRGSTPNRIRNVFVIFCVSGFWHGANWTFVAWGILHALFFLPLMLTSRNRAHLRPVAEGRLLPRASEVFSIVRTFGLTTLAWVFFRAESVSEAFAYLGGVFSSSIVSVPAFPLRAQAFTTICLLIPFLWVEWIGRTSEHPLELMNLVRSRTIRWTTYWLLIALIVVFGGEQQVFIYFQF